MTELSWIAISIASLLLLELLYINISKKVGIFDAPDARKSHSYQVIRGGGIIFPASVLMFHSTFEGLSSKFIFALCVISLISLIDDLRSIKASHRMIVHIISVSIIIISLMDASWVLIALCVVMMIYWVNIFNFMDGINGITTLYSMVSILTIYYINLKLNLISNYLLISILCSLVVFGIFNLRKKALAFAGDVGSISISLIIGYITFKFILFDNNISYLLFFTVYALDSTITITIRLIRKENIFQPHRKHLYQILVNELGYPHLTIASIYAIIQIVINIIVIIYMPNELENSIYFVISFSIITTFIYLISRKKLTKIVRSKRYDKTLLSF